MKLGLLALAAVLGGCELIVHFDPVAESGAQCFDGLDNDGDGKIDCADEGCAAMCKAPDAAPADAPPAADARPPDARAPDAGPPDARAPDAGCGLTGPQTIAVANGPFAVVAAHVHSGGETDVLVATSKELVELQNVSGTLTARTPLDVAGVNTVVGLVAGSFDTAAGDDAIVLVSSTAGASAAQPLFDSDGTYKKGQAVSLRSTPRAIVAGDYNGKPPDDAVVALAGGAVFLVNGGAGTFTSSVADIATPVALAGGDANTDSHADIAMATAGGQVAIFFGGTAGSSFPFTPAAGVTLGAAPLALAFADLDGKNDLDVLALEPTSVVPLFAAADGTLTSGTAVAVGGTALAFAAADLDGDGDTDLAVGLASGTIALFHGDGAGGFKPAGTLTVAHPDAILALALDASHAPSLVVAEREDNLVLVFRNGCGLP